MAYIPYTRHLDCVMLGTVLSCVLFAHYTDDETLKQIVKLLYSPKASYGPVRGAKATNKKTPFSGQTLYKCIVRKMFLYWKRAAAE